MAAIDWNMVTAFAPELASVDASAQADILAHANAALDVSKLDGEDGARTKLARIYLAAHHGARVGGGNAGPVIMRSEGPVMEQFASPSQGASHFSETSYGRRYLEIVRTSKARGPMVS